LNCVVFVNKKKNPLQKTFRELRKTVLLIEVRKKNCFSLNLVILADEHKYKYIDDIYFKSDIYFTI